MVRMFIRVWEYDVAADRVDAFAAAYGAEGDWARLFRQGRGYVGTELHRSTDDPARFVTVDRWTDERAWRSFLVEFRDAYHGLDRALAPLSVSQRAVLEGSA